jgi:hypothetical protein
MKGIQGFNFKTCGPWIHAECDTKQLCQVQDWKCPPLGFTYTETPKNNYRSASYVTLHKYFFYI